MSNGSGQRSSIFTGLLLILLGLLFLLQRFDPQLGIGHLLAHYWPVLLILWGVAKLIDHFTAQRTGQGRPPILSGPEAALMFLVIAVLVGMSLRDWLPGWISSRDSSADDDISFFEQKYSDSQEMPAKTIPAGAQVIVQTGRGNITLHASEGSEIRVGVSKAASGSSETSARERMRNVRVAIDQSRDGYTIHPAFEGGSDDGVSINLDVEVPKQVVLWVNSARGDISISGVAGAINAEAGNGDIEIHDVRSDVTAKLQKGDARITDTGGNVVLSGKGNEIEVGDVRGNATLAGDFFGPIHVRNVSKTTRYTSQRSDLTLTGLTGRLELDSGDLQVSDVSGPAKLLTQDKDVDVENVAGRLDISNTRGDIQVRYSQPPREAINIANQTGEVELTLPSAARFEISAVSRSGEARSEFDEAGIEPANDNSTGRLNGKIGTGGPKITITTTYGTISLKKS
jgi:DUF4097 and DUF4098 domain-containing protein YvlB